MIFHKAKKNTISCFRSPLPHAGTIVPHFSDEKTEVSDGYYLPKATQLGVAEPGFEPRHLAPDATLAVSGFPCEQAQVSGGQVRIKPRQASLGCTRTARRPAGSPCQSTGPLPRTPFRALREGFGKQPPPGGVLSKLPCGAGKHHVCRRAVAVSVIN